MSQAIALGNPVAATTTPIVPINSPNCQNMRFPESRVIDEITSAISRNTSPRSNRSAFLCSKATSCSSLRASLSISF